MAPKERSSPRGAREGNRRLALEHLFEAPNGLTRPELARLMGLSVPAVASLVSSSGDMLSEVLDKAADPSRARATGPSPEVIRIKPRLGHVVGIVLGHTYVQVAHADLHGTYDPQRDAHKEPWDVEGDLHGALAFAAKTVKRLADEHSHRVEPEDIAAICLAVGAPVHIFEDGGKRRGLLRVGLGPPGHSSPWLNIDPLAALTNHLAALPDGERWSAIRRYVDNDAHLGALAELRRGAGRGSKNIIYIRVDDGGIGAGLVLSGRIYRGAGGIAGEFGHVVVERDRSDVVCRRCGRPCVEAVVGSMLGCHDGSCDPPIKERVLAAVDGDAESIASITKAAKYLGWALGGLVTVLNPDLILIGGPFPPSAYGLIIPPIQQALDALTIVPAARDYVLELGALREDAVLDGAIWLALGHTRVDFLLRHAAAAAASARAAARTKSTGGATLRAKTHHKVVAPTGHRS